MWCLNVHVLVLFTKWTVSTFNINHHSCLLRYDLTESLNGCLAGCVSITPICAFIEPWAACIVGASGALVYILGVWCLEVLYIDDPVAAVPVHAFCGAWGVILGGFFATKPQ